MSPLIWTDTLIYQHNYNHHTGRAGKGTGLRGKLYRASRENRSQLWRHYRASGEGSYTDPTQVSIMSTQPNLRLPNRGRSLRCLTLHL